MSVQVDPKNRRTTPLDTHGVSTVQFTSETAYKGKHLDRTYPMIEGPRKVRSSGHVLDRTNRGINPFDRPEDVYYANASAPTITREEAARVHPSQIPTGKGIIVSGKLIAGAPDETSAGWLVGVAASAAGATIHVPAESLASWDLILDDLIARGRVKDGRVRFIATEQPQAAQAPLLITRIAFPESDLQPTLPTEPIEVQAQKVLENPLEPTPVAETKVIERMNAALALDQVQSFTPLAEGQSSFDADANPDNVKTAEEPKAQEEPPATTPVPEVDPNLE